MIFKFTYLLIAKIYSIFFSYYENFFLRKKNKFVKKPLYRFKNNIIEKYNYDEFEKITQNKYLTKVIFPENKIFNIIEMIFKKNGLAQKITEITGFKYTINFFTAYKIFKISDQDISKAWYANNFHIDKPYSENMVKIFMSFEKIDENKGPMIIKDDKIYKATIDENEILMFLPNQYYHKASSPIDGSRFLIMFQLNPSNDWKINEKIFNKQKKIEPKFPFFTSFFDKKIKI